MCRALARVTGRNFGGQFMVALAPSDEETMLEFEVELITVSTDEREELWMGRFSTAAVVFGRRCN